MSRIIVKNLGKKTSESQVEQHFSSKGEVTDVRIAKTSGGNSRRFAFVGFRTAAQAEAATAYFNNTFLGTTKITVEPAKKVGDATLVEKAEAIKKAKSRTKASDESNSGVVAMSSSSSIPEKPTEHKAMSKNKQEFMDAMRERRSTRVWENDDGLGVHGPDAMDVNGSLGIDGGDDEEKKKKKKKKGGKRRTATGGTDSASDSSSSSESDDDSDSDSDEEEIKGKSKVGAGAMSDMDFLRSKMVRKAEFSDSSDDENDDGHKKNNKRKGNDAGSYDDEQNARPDSEEENEADTGELGLSTLKGKKQDAEDDEDLAASGRLFMRNLPYSVTEDEIIGLFEPHGTLTEVHLPLDADKRAKGFGFVQFLFPEEAERAREALDGEAFQGRLLHIITAKAKEEHELSGSKTDGKFVVGKSAFQRARDEARKNSKTDVMSWNASHVRGDAVVGAISNEYGIDKAAFMDVNGSNAGDVAVRMAIGETHVLQENREYFASHGVDTTFLRSDLKDGETNKNTAKSKRDKASLSMRSSTVLLVKNLPNETDKSDLSGLFARYGSVLSFLLPPSKTVAIVEYAESSEAKKAFSALAYRKYKHVPMYIEWAPRGVLENRKEGEVEGAADSVRTKGSDGSALKLSAGAEDESAAVPTQTVYVKNLNFNTTEDALITHVQQLGFPLGKELRTASLPKNTRVSGQNAGYGFVEFCNVDIANRGVIKISGSKLDGHVLDAKLSGKQLGAQQNRVKRGISSASKDTTSSFKGSKLIVRNVAFQATEKEIRSLFMNFGDVKRVRIPKKMGGSHRGFAFVDFTTHAEAAAAVNALANTHLYGRHLVIEWAKEDDVSGIDVATLRNKAGLDAKALAASAQRKRKERDDGFD